MAGKKSVAPAPASAGPISRSLGQYDWQPLEEFMYELFRNAGFDWDEVERQRLERRRLGTL